MGYSDLNVQRSVSTDLPKTEADTQQIQQGKMGGGHTVKEGATTMTQEQQVKANDTLKQDEVPSNPKEAYQWVKHEIRREPGISPKIAELQEKITGKTTEKTETKKTNETKTNEHVETKTEEAKTEPPKTETKTEATPLKKPLVDENPGGMTRVPIRQLKRSLTSTSLTPKSSPQMESVRSQMAEEDKAANESADRLIGKIAENKEKLLSGNFKTPTGVSIDMASGKVTVTKNASGADMRTAQGAQANITAAKTQACISSAIAHADGVALAKIAGDGPPKEQFDNLMRCLSEVADNAKLGDVNDCKLLNALGGLMTKGFAGGIGTFQGPGRDPKWKDFTEDNSKVGSSGIPFKVETHKDITWKDAGIDPKELEKQFPNQDINKLMDIKITDAQYEEISKKNPGLKEKVDSKVNQNNEKNIPNNQEVLKDFKNMLEWYSKNGAQHFTPSENRHQAGVELASVQLAATLGQLVHDFVLESSMPSGGTLLKDVMLKQGLIENKSSFDNLAGLEKQMRSNPLLAEVPNTTIAGEVKGAFDKGTAKREEMVNILEKHLKDVNTGPEPLSDKDIKELAGKLVDQFQKEIDGMKFKTANTGARGRTTAAFNDAAKKSMKELSNAVMGKQPNAKTGENETLADMPRTTDNKAATEYANACDPSIKGLNEAIAKDHLLYHAGSPGGFLRMGTGLDSGLKNLAMHPGEFLQKLINSDKNIDPRHANILKALSGELGRRDVNAEMQKVLIGTKNADGKYQGGIDVTFNKATKQKMPLGDFANMDSVASIMYENNLRTLCSISGTTVDTVVGLSLVLGTDGMKKVLDPLMKFAANPKDFSPLNGPEGQTFKEVFSAISFFMQGGQYHTAAEVLGGLFIAGRGLAATDGNGKAANLNIDQTFAAFKGLMEAFGKNPENFLAVREEDKANLTDATRLKTLAQQIAT